MKRLGLLMLQVLEFLAPWIALLLLRVLLGWGFFESGMVKHDGMSALQEFVSKLPEPFNAAPSQTNWKIMTWLELIGGAALVAGLGTRLFACAFIALAWLSMDNIHWPMSANAALELLKCYAIPADALGKFRFPIVYLAMLAPLLLAGPGKLSIDHLIRRTVLKA